MIADQDLLRFVFMDRSTVDVPVSSDFNFPMTMMHCRSVGHYLDNTHYVPFDQGLVGVFYVRSGHAPVTTISDLPMAMQ